MQEILKLEGSDLNPLSALERRRLEKKVEAFYILILILVKKSLTL